ncbi:MAG: DUF2597 family protein [Algicola sp.]|nr:DUF2597 family protein [Algicola sp.]
MEHISGKSLRVKFGVHQVLFDEFDLTIDDQTGPASTGGRPDGFVDGETSASGTLTLAHKYFKVFSDAAKAAGSYKAMPLFDIVTYGKTTGSELKIEAFGCKLKISDLLKIDPNGKDKSSIKLDYFVTSPDFVNIDGVPYLSPDETI